MKTRREAAWVVMVVLCCPFACGPDEPWPAPVASLGQALDSYSGFTGWIDDSCPGKKYPQMQYSCAANVDAPDGTKSIRFEWRKANYDPTSADASLLRRAEYRTDYFQKVSTAYQKAHEAWYGFRIYFSATALSLDSGGVILTQDHTPVKTSSGTEIWSNPITDLYYKKGLLRYAYRGDINDAVTPDANGRVAWTHVGQDIPLGMPIYDAWNDFVYHQKFDQTGQGLIEIWFNGEYVSRKNIVLGYKSSQRGPLWKFGCYYYEATSDFPQRVVYFTDVKVMLGSGSHDQVAPPPPKTGVAGYVDPHAQGPLAQRPVPSCDPIPPRAVTASTYQWPYYPSSSMDNDLTTRWSAEGDGMWIDYDLGDPQLVEGVAVAFHSGSQRTAKVDIQASLDGASYQTVDQLQGNGTTDEPQLKQLATAQLARSIRLLGHGNSQNKWNSFTEVALCRAASSSSDMGTRDMGTQRDSRLDDQGQPPARDATPTGATSTGGCAVGDAPSSSPWLLALVILLLGGRLSFRWRAAPSPAEARRPGSAAL